MIRQTSLQAQHLRELERDLSLHEVHGDSPRLKELMQAKLLELFLPRLMSFLEVPLPLGNAAGGFPDPISSDSGAEERLRRIHQLESVLAAEVRLLAYAPRSYD